MSQTGPNTMYEMYGVLKSDLAKNHTAFVDMMAAHIATLKWMRTPRTSTRSRSSVPSSEIPNVMKSAMQQYLAMGFWTQNGSGMPRSTSTT